jgi:hypothetical protein
VAHANLLRVSSTANDLELDLDVVRGDLQESDAIQHAPELAALVDASINDLASLPSARSALVEATDEATMLDAAAVVANFEMMTRIADGTGTRHPVDRLESMSEVSNSMGLGVFASARI